MRRRLKKEKNNTKHTQERILTHAFFALLHFQETPVIQGVQTGGQLREICPRLCLLGVHHVMVNAKKTKKRTKFTKLTSCLHTLYDRRFLKMQQGKKGMC